MKLQVWWIPQVPMNPFHIPVNSVEEAALITDTLAMYDIFQFENNIKPDYTNAGGLQYFDEKDNEWLDWYNEETGDSFEEYCENNKLGWANKSKETDGN